VLSYKSGLVKNVCRDIFRYTHEQCSAKTETCINNIRGFYTYIYWRTNYILFPGFVAAAVAATVSYIRCRVMAGSDMFQVQTTAGVVEEKQDQSYSRLQVYQRRCRCALGAEL
jgi:hypothetical protein